MRSAEKTLANVPSFAIFVIKSLANVHRPFAVSAENAIAYADSVSVMIATDRCISASVILTAAVLPIFL